ncbi:MAG TPA: Uma2 family endonuclease [Methylomirabilota bacterium]|nr:Uma2 family endonuclease [Methylomirabilota bacterium]
MDATIELKRRRFSVKEYHRLIEVGVLTKDDRVELLEGEIVEMTPIGERHAGTVNRLTHLFVSWFGARAVVHVQSPILLGPEVSVPQPDVALLAPRQDFYTTRRPEPDDVLLVIEVMDSSVQRDRRVKLPLYARAGIVEVWLLDLNTDRLEVYRRPTAGGYAESRVLQRDEPISIQAFPDVWLTVADLLG